MKKPPRRLRRLIFLWKLIQSKILCLTLSCSSDFLASFQRSVVPTRYKMLSPSFLSRLLQVALQFGISIRALSAVRGAVSWVFYFKTYALRLAYAFTSDYLKETSQIFTALLSVDFIRLAGSGVFHFPVILRMRSNFSPRAV